MVRAHVLLRNPLKNRNIRLGNLSNRIKQFGQHKLRYNLVQNRQTQKQNKQSDQIINRILLLDYIFVLDLDYLLIIPIQNIDQHEINVFVIIIKILQRVANRVYRYLQNLANYLLRGLVQFKLFRVLVIVVLGNICPEEIIPDIMLLHKIKDAFNFRNMGNYRRVQI